MRVAIIGAGFTGLAAALRLLQQGHIVTIFEKEDVPGGLAMGFENSDWDWSLEKAYHHWFTNDASALNLAQQLHYKVIVKKPQTNILVNSKILPFDSPLALLNFTPLPLFDRLRTAFGVGFLKLLPSSKIFEGKKAVPWIKSVMGEKSYKVVWEPILKSKFNSFIDTIALTWFWARIYKRTPSLAYPEGGFKKFAEKLQQEIIKRGGKIYFNSQISQIKSADHEFILETSRGKFTTDKILSTLPSPILAKITPDLPKDYSQKISSVPHLHAQNLILVFKKPFLTDGSYWVSIADQSFPFLVLAEHTNFMSPQFYHNQHILYIGNYLPQGHPYLQMTPTELLKIFDPYLQKIHPDYQESLIESHLFNAPFAQPVVSVNYLDLIPTFHSPISGLYVANMDMVYPWDRGTNYAIEMGEKVAEIIDEEGSI